MQTCGDCLNRLYLTLCNPLILDLKAVPHFSLQVNSEPRALLWVATLVPHIAAGEGEGLGNMFKDLPVQSKIEYWETGLLLITDVDVMEKCNLANGAIVMSKNLCCFICPRVVGTGIDDLNLGIPNNRFGRQ